MANRPVKRPVFQTTTPFQQLTADYHPMFIGGPAINNDAAAVALGILSAPITGPEEAGAVVLARAAGGF
jgi:hypothetical protein